MTHAWTHAWCKSPARDEAVREAEDGRDRPLPTLKECIAAPFAEAAERSPSMSKTGDGQSGMRTERVTLEITHGNAPFGFHGINWHHALLYAGLIARSDVVRAVSDEEPQR